MSKKLKENTRKDLEFECPDVVTAKGYPLSVFDKSRSTLKDEGLRNDNNMVGFWRRHV